MTSAPHPSSVQERQNPLLRTGQCWFQALRLSTASDELTINNVKFTTYDLGGPRNVQAQPYAQFPDPKPFIPEDCTGITDRTELQAVLKYALGRYKRHLQATRRDQVEWAKTMKPWLRPDDELTLAKAERRLESQEYMPRYLSVMPTRYEPGQPQNPRSEIRDTVLIDAEPLFTYSSWDRVELQVVDQGLHVSKGAVRKYEHQQVRFPVGPYGTTIAPYRDDISQAAMRREFFDIESSLPSIFIYEPIMQAVIPMTHWIMFVPTTGFSKKGHLVFSSRLNSSFEETFDHYVMETPHLHPGIYSTYVPYDIIAFGDNLIPEEIHGMQVARANVDEPRVLVTVNMETASRFE